MVIPYGSPEEEADAKAWEVKAFHRYPRKRPRIGDLVEIPTDRGFAYAHYTHKHSSNGALIRVLKGFHSQRPDNLVQIAEGEGAFDAFTPLGSILNAGIFGIADNVPIAPDRQSFPVFRSRLAMPEGQPEAPWFLWDGERAWPVGTLSHEQWKLPLDGIITARMVEDRIVSEWSQERAEW